MAPSFIKLASSTLYSAENVSHVMPQNTIFNSLGQQGCMTIVLANWGGVWVDLSADPDKICFGQQGS